MYPSISSAGKKNQHEWFSISIMCLFHTKLLVRRLRKICIFNLKYPIVLYGPCQWTQWKFREKCTIVDFIFKRWLHNVSYFTYSTTQLWHLLSGKWLYVPGLESEWTHDQWSAVEVMLLDFHVQVIEDITNCHHIWGHTHCGVLSHHPRVTTLGPQCYKKVQTTCRCFSYWS